MLERLALYVTLGILCDALGHPATSMEFWCFIGLFWAVDILGTHSGFDRARELHAAMLVQAHAELVRLEALLSTHNNSKDPRDEQQP